MKNYLLLSIALFTPQILFADQSTESSPMGSIRQVQAVTQKDQEFSFIDIMIERIENNPKLSKSFKSACANCVGNFAAFKNRTLPPETMNQVASAVKDFSLQNNIAPEMKYFQNK